MLIKCAFALVLASAFFYRIVRDSSGVVKKLVASRGETLSHEAMNPRVLISLIPWIAAIWYYENVVLISLVILYELVLYVVIISLSFMVYRFYRNGNQADGQ